MDFKDYDASLGVAKTATGKEIKQAFRRLARKHHPDVNPGDRAAEAKFKEINEAHEVLSDPDKRRKYDELGANWRMYEQAGPGAGGGGAPGWDGTFTTRSGGPRTMSEDEMREMFGDGDPFSAFFHTFFGGTAGTEPGGRQRSGSGRTARQGRDVEHALELGLEDAFHGTTQRLSLRHDGQARTVDVRIPAGVTDGSRVRISGEGETGSGGARSGDLYLRIRLAPHTRFERKGRDLHTRVAIPLTRAVLGGETEVVTIGGKSLRLRIPPLTQNGQVFRLKGHGMPAVGKPDQTGDLYAAVEVQLPRDLTPEQRAHFEALSELETGPKPSAV
jgi:DnaJ-class molecular chaperone